jgi:hypothetical protein
MTSRMRCLLKVWRAVNTARGIQLRPHSPKVRRTPHDRVSLCYFDSQLVSCHGALLGELWIAGCKMNSHFLISNGCRKSTLNTLFRHSEGRREGCRGISSPHASSASASQQCLGELHCKQNAGLTPWRAAYRLPALDCCAGSYGAAHHPIARIW